MQGRSILETRREQVFPILEAAEIERVRRFGTVRRYADGDPLAIGSCRCYGNRTEGPAAGRHARIARRGNRISAVLRESRYEHAGRQEHLAPHRSMLASVIAAALR